MVRISKISVEGHGGQANLIPRHVIVVRVASFAFRFESVERLRECIRYYEKKTRPSSRIAARTLAAELGEDWREQYALHPKQLYKLSLYAEGSKCLDARV